MSNPNKTYLYKVYGPTGAYLGILQNVSSEFTYNQTIATGSVQVAITVAQSPDVIGAVSAILDENSNQVLDETGAVITDEGQSSVVGDSAPQIDENNIIEVYEFSTYHVNGILRFTGYISKWEAIFGGDDDIVITCISLGADLSQVLIASGDTAYISQTTTDNSTYLVGLTSAKAGSFNAVAQTFTVAATTVLGGISVELTTPEIGTITLQVYRMLGSSPNPSSDTLIAYNTINMPQTGTATVQQIDTPPYPTLTTGNTYYFLVFTENSSGDVNEASIYADASNPYANGTAWAMVFGGTAWTATNESPSDLYFVIYAQGNNVTGAYTGADPSTILTSVMNNYISQGGGVILPPGGFALTGVSATYTFSSQTILAGIAAIFAFAPANWYWYVSPDTNTLQFAQYNTVADIMIIKGRHIDELDLTGTKETIANTVYVTGGNGGSGSNIFVEESVPQGTNRIGMVQLSDNRITSATGGNAAAEQIASAYIANHSARSYTATIIIQDQTMDLTTLKLGKVLGFSGFGSFIDQLLLPIVGVNPNGDQVTLQIGSLPIANTALIQAIYNQLNQVVTVANPPTPA